VSKRELVKELAIGSSGLDAQAGRLIIGRINPADCPNVQRLLAEADRELYRRKRDRKDGVG